LDVRPKIVERAALSATPSSACRGRIRTLPFTPGNASNSSYRRPRCVFRSEVRLKADTTYEAMSSTIVVSGFPPPPKALARLAEARDARESGSRTEKREV
jgi:hypothetical protein